MLFIVYEVDLRVNVYFFVLFYYFESFIEENFVC